MTHSELLQQERAGRDAESSPERRRARLLARILESAPRLHEKREPTVVLTALESIVRTIFPGSHYLVIGHGADLGDGRQQEEILRTNLSTSDIDSRRRLVQEVARAGVPSFEPDIELPAETIASCVPLRIRERRFGALHLEMPADRMTSSDELTAVLRLLAQQTAIAMACAADVEGRSSGDDGDVAAILDDHALSLADSKRSFERSLLIARLRESRGNIAAAARLLHMDRGQLSRLVKRHGIDASSFKR